MPKSFPTRWIERGRRSDVEGPPSQKRIAPTSIFVEEELEKDEDESPLRWMTGAQIKRVKKCSQRCVVASLEDAKKSEPGAARRERLVKAVVKGCIRKCAEKEEERGR